MPFRLEKAYIDAVDPAGRWLIGYDATLRWGPLRFHYREISRSDLVKGRLGIGTPAVSADRIEVSKGQAISLRALTGGPSHLGFKNDVLEWRLVHRGSDVDEVRGGASRALPGAGYGEIITLHAPPWALGIKELHWGRLVAPSCFVTWIIASGARPIHFGVVDNSLIHAGLGQNNREIRLGETLLHLGETRQIITDGDALSARTGPVRTLLRVLAPSLSVLQHKAVYAAQLERPDRGREHGLAIAETVRFNASGRLGLNGNQGGQIG
jgi:hypothetical protein